MLSVNPVAPDIPQSAMYKGGSSAASTVSNFGCLEDETNNNIQIDNNFGKLINQLRGLLGGKGLSSDDVDVAQIRAAMQQYQSDEQDWGRFALSDATKGYTRNGVVNINGNANLLILVWSPGKGSAIHDHANAHCCMKVMKGALQELLYDVPTHEGAEMVPKKVTTLERDQVGYISDTIGLHKISNALEEDFAVSLHLYTPPYAALYGCLMYESGTLRKHHVNMSKYYSWQGKRISEGSTC